MISMDPDDNGFYMQLRQRGNYPVYGNNVAGEWDNCLLMSVVVGWPTGNLFIIRFYIQTGSICSKSCDGYSWKMSFHSISDMEGSSPFGQCAAGRWLTTRAFHTCRCKSKLTLRSAHFHVLFSSTVMKDGWSQLVIYEEERVGWFLSLLFIWKQLSQNLEDALVMCDTAAVEFRM